MSKMKRKWLRVIEYEETGRPLDDDTRASLLETHPDLPILHDADAMPQAHDNVDAELQSQTYYSMAPPTPSTMQMHVPQAHMMQSPYPHAQQISIAPQLDSQLQEQLEREIASEDTSRD